MKHHPTNETKGFTLIELLIVVGILAILAVVVVLTLNPAQLLAQSRDATRISDLSTINSALSLYLADSLAPVVGSSTQRCYAHASSAIPSGAGCGARFAAGTNTTTTSRGTDGNGWVPVNFVSISSGSPLPVLPIDAVNDNTYFYAYSADQANFTWELNANMESIRYRQGGGGDIESTDGGTTPGIYEIGSDPGLNL